MPEAKVNLKPCPHCGSKDLKGPHFEEYTGDTRTPSWWVECTQCPCGMQVDGEADDPLREAWNKRTIDTSPYLDVAEFYEDGVVPSYIP